MRKIVRKELLGSTIAIIYAILMIVARLPLIIITMMLTESGKVLGCQYILNGYMANIFHGWYLLAGILAYRSRKRVAMKERNNSIMRWIIEISFLIFSTLPLIPLINVFVLSTKNQYITNTVIEDPVAYLPIYQIWTMVAYYIQLRKSLKENKGEEQG